MKKLVIPTLIVSIFALLTFNSLQAEVREWTQAATGNKIKGEFIKQKDEKTVTLRINARNHDIPVASLSEADQAYIKEQASKADSGKAMEKKGDDKKKGDKPALPEGEVTVVLSDVHLCCKSCIKDAEAVGANKKLVV